MRTLDEIKARMATEGVQRGSGHELGFLAGYLMLNKPRDMPSLLRELQDLMPDAWRVANSRSMTGIRYALAKISVILWLLGEGKAADAIRGFTFYSKPQLRAVCEHYSLDWHRFDDAQWSNFKGARGMYPEQVDRVDLGFSSH